MITGVAHIAFRVANMERSLAFYCGVLGLKELTRLNRDDGSLWLIYLNAGNGTIIELFPGGVATPPTDPQALGYAHFSLGVDDMHETLAEMRARGLKEEGEPKRGADGNLGFWVTDPDGIRIELMEMSADSIQGRALAAG